MVEISYKNSTSEFAVTGQALTTFLFKINVFRQTMKSRQNFCEELVLKPCLSANAVMAQQRRQQERNGEGVSGLSLNTMPQ